MAVSNNRMSRIALLLLTTTTLSLRTCEGDSNPSGYRPYAGRVPSPRETYGDGWSDDGGGDDYSDYSDYSDAGAAYSEYEFSDYGEAQPQMSGGSSTLFNDNEFELDLSDGGQYNVYDDEIHESDVGYSTPAHTPDPISSLFGGTSDNFAPPTSTSRSSDKGALYDAYNELHSLAQAYDMPFDAPAVVVVGHQSSGKSALIEALMGFQFNQVGGGTKTRRPVALRMQYNPLCNEPRWFLVGDDGKETPQTLSDIQDYIERENRRLERDPNRSFDSREINLRMEYKHCPNMILIDTPGLIAAPRIPKGRSASSKALAQQRALQASAREAEKLVVEKMGCEDYIILCVEDTNDWKHGATREVVQKADPDLSRTVIVNTKFDTKIPQFGNPSDVEDFLKAPVLDKITPHKMGGPYFTSVPSGRVGRPDGEMAPEDYLFDTDEDFVLACRDAETGDRNSVISRLRRLGKSDKSGIDSIADRVGLRKLRTYLEEKVDECYRRNVRKIIPMLQAEYSTTEGRLKATERELESLSIERLQSGADAFCDEFCANLRKAMQGTIVAPVTVFGETLTQEAATSGSFHAVQGSPMAVSDRTWDRLIDSEVGNKEHRLYGGSQYHRTLREFHLATKCLRTPVITEDEIANAGGIGDTHDGANFLHASCVIAVEKARVSFEPMLGALQARMAHVMERLCPVAEYMLREQRDRRKVKSYTKDAKEADGSKKFEEAMDVSQNPLFRQLVKDIYERFVGKCSESAMSRCRDDLVSMTRYVTWSLDERGSGALTRALPDQASIVSIYQATLDKTDVDEDEEEAKANEKMPKKEELMAQKPLPAIANRRRSVDRDYQNLVQLMEEAFMSRDATRTNIVVGGLVQHIVGAWREQFCREVTTKFNCYFMLPFVEDFHRFIRTELNEAYDGTGGKLKDVFDLTTVRRSLATHRDELQAECDANKRLQEKFEICAKQMNDDPGAASIFLDR